MNRPYFLQYDIPEVNRRPVCENPSDSLWHARAVRITYSCWLIMESDLQGPVNLILNHLTSRGARWYAVPFDVSATEQLREMALANICREISERMDSARATRDEAETRLADESDTDYAARRRRYLAQARSIEKRVTEMIARVLPAAERFGITPADLRASSVVGDVELIAANMRSRAAAFARAHGILTRKAPDHEVTRALRRGEIPVQVASDFLREIDEPDAADDVFSSFGGI